MHEMWVYNIIHTTSQRRHVNSCLHKCIKQNQIKNLNIQQVEQTTFIKQVGSLLKLETFGSCALRMVWWAGLCLWPFIVLICKHHKHNSIISW